MVASIEPVTADTPAWTARIGEYEYVDPVCGEHVLGGTQGRQ